MDQQMSQRMQACFFIAIVFLFGFGASLLVYKDYNEFYQDQVATSNEIASTPAVKLPSAKPATATSTKNQ